jgi:hypothetical protein
MLKKGIAEKKGYSSRRMAKGLEGEKAAAR